MAKLDWKITVRNKYSHLLVALLAIFVITPFLNRLNLRFPVAHCLFFAITLMILRVLHLKKAVYITLILLVFAGLAMEYMLYVDMLSSFNDLVSLVVLALYAVIVGISTWYLTINIFSEQSVSGDTIKGGISIYFLIGFWWAIVYYIVMLFNPEAFVYTLDIQDAMDFQYFSFSTLTTVGYGDIVAKSDIATMLTSLESVTGPLYLAVLVARLVSLHVLAKTRR